MKKKKQQPYISSIFQNASKKEEYNIEMNKKVLHDITLDVPNKTVNEDIYNTAKGLRFSQLPLAEIFIPLLGFLTSKP